MKFDLGRGLNIALAQRGKNRAWLADAIKRTPSEITRFAGQNWTNQREMQKMADALDLKLSELIALCETV